MISFDLKCTQFLKRRATIFVHSIQNQSALITSTNMLQRFQTEMRLVVELKSINFL